MASARRYKTLAIEGFWGGINRRSPCLQTYPQALPFTRQPVKAITGICDPQQQLYTMALAVRSQPSLKAGAARTVRSRASAVRPVAALSQQQAKVAAAGVASLALVAAVAAPVSVPR